MRKKRGVQITHINAVFKKRNVEKVKEKRRMKINSTFHYASPFAQK